MNRRSFNRNTMFLILGACAAPFSMTGCGLLSDLQAWIPIANAAISGIVTVIGTFMPPGALLIINIIKAALSDLGSTIAQYEADSNPADKATWEAKISTILTDIASNFQNFLAQLNLGNNPIMNIVIGLAQVVLAAIEGFLGQLPATAKTKTIGTSFIVGGKLMAVTPKYYKKVQQFKSDYNAVCIQYNHTEIEIK
jgi:hypothetical protein